MFTGIIQAVGKIVALERRQGDIRIGIDVLGLDMADVRAGDSIAVNGVCLTALDPELSRFSADVSAETLARTTLGGLSVAAPVNLEKALTPQSRLGGHLVSGHVDGVGEVRERRIVARSVRFCVQAPAELARYIATKGSICADGVSLTVNAVDGATFDINIVPHTLNATTLAGWQPGQRINLEVDLVARYLERLLLGDRAAQGGAVLNREFLAEHGFLKK